MAYATLDNWIEKEAIPFSIESPEAVNAAVDKLVASLDDSVKLLGFGEALHGGEEILMLRNRLFQRLVERHGYSAIAIESSFPRGLLVNEYVSGRHEYMAGGGPASYQDMEDTGFSHSFGKLEANRELVEWMRQYNANPDHPVRIQFYGFDSPTEMMGTDSPRQVLTFVLDYLASIDGSDQELRSRIDSLLGADSDWENPAAMMDPTQSVGLSDAASKLRIETEDLIMQLQVRRPELIARSDRDRYLEALQHASAARNLLNYHAELARESEERTAVLLGIRDTAMADNLAYAVTREHGRGKVFAFAHNRHLQQGKAEWQLGPQLLRWWPAGAHLGAMLGDDYVVIGTGVGVSAENGIGQPEAGSLEALFASQPESALFIPTHQAEGLPASEINSLAPRSGSRKNPGYFSFDAATFTDFDWLAFVGSTGYSRGGPALPDIANGLGGGK